MPFTPLHFGPGGAIHALAPHHISFTAFVVANVIVDTEPFYYILTKQEPLHRFLHTYVGATLVTVATILLFILARKIAPLTKLPNVFHWQELTLRQAAIGAGAGCYSHILLDSVMHADIRPLAPFSQTNALYLLVSIDQLNSYCLWAGVASVVVLAGRRLFLRYRVKGQS